ncbi:MAG: hypothetical protein ACHQF0_17155 [Chitinophagales bacterium]
MKFSLFRIVASLCIVFYTSCKTEPFKPDFENAGGYVIGKETCNTDTTKDYWLVDLSVFPLPNSYGDSLILNGITYKHVVKTTGLASQFKFINAKVDLDFHISSSPMQTTNCNVTSPVTYSLKEINVLSQAELR